MRKGFSFVALLAAALTVVFCCYSCKDSKPAETNAEPEDVIYHYDFSSEDSLAINSLAMEYVNVFNQGDMDAVASMLYKVNGDDIAPLSDEEQRQFASAMNALPHVDCQLKEIDLRTELDNKVRIAIRTTEEADAETGDGCIVYVLNPVKVDGQWRLTIYDPYAKGVGEHQPQQ